MKQSLRITALAFFAAAALAGCKRENEIEKEVAASIVEDVAREIREEIATEALKLSGPMGAPRAVLTPQGDLLIDGVAVQMTPQQRELALAYREELAGIAVAGATLGLKGADLARDAVAEAASSLFDTDPTPVEQRVKASAEAIRKEAQALCDTLPKLIAAQDAFAQAVPEFKPYADVDQTDVTECMID